MTRSFACAVALLIAILPARAFAHVGSPDVFFDGDAGPYALSVTVRTPQVIPGIATIEIRSATPDVTAVSVVSMRLTGPGSQLPPAPDVAARSAVDPQFFTADLWLMERGSMQVRITASGARGTGVLAIPVPAAAQRTLVMSRALGGGLIALMMLLALSMIAIAAAAVREATLAAGEAPPARTRRRAIIAAGISAVAIAGIVALGNAWWDAEASDYATQIAKPWKVDASIDGCTLTIHDALDRVLPDHGHDMHLFLVREPDNRELAHLHPTRTASRTFTQQLPSLGAGTYRLFADVVWSNGFPITGTAEIDVPPLTCPPLAGDDSTWFGHGEATVAALSDGSRMIWDRPPLLRAGVALPLRFRVELADGTPAALEPYMGMAGHAEILRTDGSVFAHVHPSGSVPMPALELASGGDGGMMAMPGMAMGTSSAPAPAPLGATVAFPYGFPRDGDYRVFVQVKRGGSVLTGAFDAHVEP